MKLPLLLVLFTASVMVAHAADNDTLVQAAKPKREHQVFINTTFFIKQLINLSNSNLTISPYIVGYKCFFNQHHGLRISAGGSMSRSKDFPSSSFVRISNSSTVSPRIGYEYRRSFGKFWTFFTGMDIIGSYNHSRTLVNSDDVVTTKSNSWNIGGGPMLGIQINVHKNISLFTETAFYYTYGKERSRVSSANFPELNDNKVTSINQSASFLLPTSVYFVFKF